MNAEANSTPPTDAPAPESPKPAFGDRPINPFDNAPVVARPETPANIGRLGREVAEVQAAMQIAKAFPRDPKLAMDRVLMSFTRIQLAEDGLYQYARGGTNIEGLSIRAAEELARQWGNLACGVTELSRQGGTSECLAYAWDLETNFRDEKRFQVKHWRDTRQGGYQITDERDIYELIANMGARRKRACILAVVPSDVAQAAERQIYVTLKSNEQVTPERIKAMVEAFAKFGVTQSQLEARIQRRLDTLAEAPTLLIQLRNIHNSIKDGMSQAVDWFPPEEKPAEEGTQATGTAGKVKDRLQARAGKGEKATDPPAA